MHYGQISMPLLDGGRDSASISGSNENSDHQDKLSPPLAASFPLKKCDVTDGDLHVPKHPIDEDYLISSTINQIFKYRSRQDIVHCQKILSKMKDMKLHIDLQSKLTVCLQVLDDNVPMETAIANVQMQGKKYTKYSKTF